MSPNLLYTSYSGMYRERWLGLVTWRRLYSCDLILTTSVQLWSDLDDSDLILTTVIWSWRRLFSSDLILTTVIWSWRLWSDLNDCDLIWSWRRLFVCSAVIWSWQRLYSCDLIFPVDGTLHITDPPVTDSASSTLQELHELLQDSRLLYHLIREIKTWLNINHITVHDNT